MVRLEFHPRGAVLPLDRDPNGVGGNTNVLWPRDAQEDATGASGAQVGGQLRIARFAGGSFVVAPRVAHPFEAGLELPPEQLVEPVVAVHVDGHGLPARALVNQWRPGHPVRPSGGGALHPGLTGGKLRGLQPQVQHELGRVCRPRAGHANLKGARLEHPSAVAPHSCRPQLEQVLFSKRRAPAGLATPLLGSPVDGAVGSVDRGLVRGQVCSSWRVQARLQLVGKRLAQSVVHRVEHCRDLIRGCPSPQGVGRRMALGHHSRHGFAILDASQVQPVELGREAIHASGRLVHGSQFFVVPSEQRRRRPGACGNPDWFLPARARGAAP